MVGGRLRNAMSDMAETIRRVFQDPPTLAVDCLLRAPGSRAVALPGTRALGPEFRLLPTVGGVPALAAGPPIQIGFHWEARLQAEEGWAQWATGAKVCVPALFKAEKCARLEVPALPRRPRVREEAPETFRTRARAGLEPVPMPRSAPEPCVLPAPRAHRALEHALAQPVAFTGVDIPKLSKALWMRYTLKLVRETGENIRNLDVLGLYFIPTRGTRQINHQATTGRLLVALGPEAVGAPRAHFILARKKDDDAIVCCFVQEV